MMECPYFHTMDGNLQTYKKKPHFAPSRNLMTVPERYVSSAFSFVGFLEAIQHTHDHFIGLEIVLAELLSI